MHCRYARGEQLWVNSASSAVSTTYGSGGTSFSHTPGYIAVTDAGLIAKMTGAKYNYVTTPAFSGCHCIGASHFAATLVETR